MLSKGRSKTLSITIFPTMYSQIVGEGVDAKDELEAVGPSVANTRRTSATTATPRYDDAPISAQCQRLTISLGIVESKATKTSGDLASASEVLSRRTQWEKKAASKKRTQGTTRGRADCVSCRGQGMLLRSLKMTGNPPASPKARMLRSPSLVLQQDPQQNSVY